MYLPVRSSTGFAIRATAVLTNKKTSLLKTSLVTIWKTKWRARDMPLVRTQRGAQDSALFSHNYTVLERRRTATERREEDEEREQNDDTNTRFISRSWQRKSLFSSYEKPYSNNLPADSMLQNREMNFSL